MTRHTNPASPTKLHSPSRAWRAIAAMLFSVLLAPTAAFADATAPAAPATAEQNAATAATPAVAPVATDPAQAALNEVTVLSRLAHPNITRFYGAWRTPEALHILMEYADGGSLADALKERATSGRLLDEDRVADWFVQIVSALAFMHSQS